MREVRPVDTDVVELFSVVHHWVTVNTVVAEVHPRMGVKTREMKVIVDSVVMKVHLQMEMNTVDMKVIIDSVWKYEIRW